MIDWGWSLGREGGGIGLVLVGIQCRSVECRVQRGRGWDLLSARFASSPPHLVYPLLLQGLHVARTCLRLTLRARDEGPCEASPYALRPSTVRASLRRPTSGVFFFSLFKLVTEQRIIRSPPVCPRLRGPPPLPVPFEQCLPHSRTPNPPLF